MSWFSSLFSKESKPTESNASVFFTNTLSGKKEIFSPLKAGQVTMYSCGPTVYSKQHIGNLKAPLFADLVARVLAQAGYRVRRVINITDVGHLVADADSGEDKMERSAKEEQKTPQEIAARYANLFLEDIRALNIDTNQVSFPRASEYIPEQVAMIETLEKKGLTYRTSDGIYFDTGAFAGYGKLGGVADALRKEYALADLGRRIPENKEKRHPADFALWKFSIAGDRRLQEWQSPWGTGFPGWHIECSAMAKALLGTTIDIHTGGMDHIPVHHNNEIAQSESANDKPLARYWLHEAFVNLGGEKISKSLGNDIYLSDIEARGFHPLALRYYFLQAHYRSPMSFSWEALAAANEALLRLGRLAREAHVAAKGRALPSEASRRMLALLRDDLSTPQALALLWEALRDEDRSPSEMLGIIETADAVLGLSLLRGDTSKEAEGIPGDIEAVARERDIARAGRDFARSDELRIHIENRGYRVEDGPSGTIVTRRPG